MKRLALLALCAACSNDRPRIVSFTASRTDVARGDPLTFSWQVSGADSLKLDPRPGTVTGTTASINAALGGNYTLVATNGAGSSSATIAVNVVDIALFSASPVEVVAGQPVTLTWKISGAVSASILGARVDPVQGYLQVSPTQDTPYKLTANSAGATITQTVVVRVGTPPTIASFVATPNPLPRGTSTVLSWQAPGAQTFSLAGGDGAGTVGPLHSRRVRPLPPPPLAPATSATLRYTLTATNPFGSTTQDLDVAVMGLAGTTLAYSDPPLGGEVLRLVRDPSTPPASPHLVLQLRSTGASLPLVVGGVAGGLDGVALNLPFDGGTPGSRDGVARVALSTVASDLSFGGLDVTTGSPTRAAALVFPATGPLSGVLALGMAQKPAAAGGPPGDAQIPADTVLATFALDLQPAGGTGTVFDGTAGDGFRLRLRSRAGDVQGTVAVGRLEVQ